MKPFLSGISVCLSFSAIILAASCAKTTPPTGGGPGPGPSKPSNDSYLSSIKNNTSVGPIVDSFTYDNSNRLTQITVIVSKPSQLSGQSTVVFSYSGSSTAPASYTINNPNQASSTHQLSYDDQNRITKDSSLDGTGLVTYWSYSNGNIISSTKNGSGEQMIDSLLFTNGNLTANNSYIANNAGTADTLLVSTQYTYDTIVNPCYHQAIASTFGPILNNLIQDGGSTDFVSGYTKSTATTSGFLGLKGLPPAQSTQTFDWTTDSKNRAATLKVTDSRIGNLWNLTFSYY